MPIYLQHRFLGVINIYDILVPSLALFLTMNVVRYCYFVSRIQYFYDSLSFSVKILSLYLSNKQLSCNQQLFYLCNIENRQRLKNLIFIISSINGILFSFFLYERLSYRLVKRLITQDCEWR